MNFLLEKEGFNVQTYLDGESALIGLSRMPPDLAVVDIKMPKMDGEELLKKLNKNEKFCNFSYYFINSINSFNHMNRYSDGPGLISY